MKAICSFALETYPHVCINILPMKLFIHEFVEKNGRFQNSISEAWYDHESTLADHLVILLFDSSNVLAVLGVAHDERVWVHCNGLISARPVAVAYCP